MKKLILFSCLLITVSVQAQKERGEAYISTYKELAMAEMLRSGVPASITLAQGILESQFGESDLVKTSNNHFGIKCKTEWTGAKTYHDDDEKAECFRVYPTAADSYKDHSDFLKTRPNYAFLFTLDPTDYDGWAKGLKKAGYATSATYPQKLLKVINDYNLQQYSLLAMERQKNGSPAMPADINANMVAATTTTGPKVSEPLTSMIAVKISEKETVIEKTVSGNRVDVFTPATVLKEKKMASYPTGVFTINHSKVIYVMEGISLLSLANQYDIPLSRLMEFNDFTEMDVLDTDRLVFLERKMKKGNIDFHIVSAGETLHGISQQEGIRMDSLLEYNHLTKNASVSTGDKLLLRVANASSSPSKSTK